MGTPPPTDPLRGVRVLVVDDDRLTLHALTAILQAAGAVVRGASSGPEAIALLREDPPDVLISDIYMPGMDGYALLHRVRELPAKEGGLTPAVAITAQPSFEVRRDAAAAGYRDVLPKPFGREHLIRIVLALVHRPEEGK
jgi:CheY-like chemotaxis protein